jgi:Protein of unknown function (DUF3435)
VQFPLLLLMTAYTSSRPGALIKSSCVRGSNDALCYGDVVLRVLPNPEEPERHILVIEVTLRFMKGKRNKSQPSVLSKARISAAKPILLRTTYIFHERDDNLALCPVSHFLALAFTDESTTPLTQARYGLLKTFTGSPNPEHSASTIASSLFVFVIIFMFIVEHFINLCMYLGYIDSLISLR